MKIGPSVDDFKELVRKQRQKYEKAAEHPPTAKLMVIHKRE
jgi:hypothetical protein